MNFSRDGYGYLNSDLAHRLYTIYRYENGDTRMNLLFRDHTLSDLIGFVYSGMPPQDAANNLIHKIKESAQPSCQWARCRGSHHSGWRECVGILPAVGARILAEIL
jgi:alpha-amylase/alpha-mannosidase (GH57 family)